MPELPKIIEDPINVALPRLLGANHRSPGAVDRFYHCVQNQKGDYDCVKKISPTTPEEGKVSQLIAINKSIPEKLDTVILRSKLTPKVIIQTEK